MVREMTHGKPLPLILGFCIPMLIGNLFQQLYSMVDAIIVGRFLDVDSLAAVGSTGSVSFLIIGFTTGITGGSCILPAQSFGAGEYGKMRRQIANAVYLCIITTAVITTAAVGFCYPILELMQTPADVIDLAYSYIVVIFGGICVTMAYNLMAGILRAMGDSRTPLIFLIIASLINIGLDLFFIVVCNMGVGGAGWATVISQAISGLLCFFHIRRHYDILEYEKGEFKFSGETLFSLAKLGVPMGLQFSITAIGSILLQSAVNTLGKTVMAAVTAAGKMQSIMVTPMETLGITMATYSGQNLGARSYRRISDGMKKAFAIGILYSVFSAVLIWFVSRYLCLLFVDSAETEVIEGAVYFIRINACFYPVLAVLFITRNMLQGVGYSLLPMTAGACELAARAVVSLVFVRYYGFNAACFATPIAWVAADILLVTVYAVKIKEIKRNLSGEG
ncbi:MAG TPA: MATE family efflux transporter [Ruminococcaceae bacterium]|nr:MATE family efflux transporter [Oscillospiraceae bacterium]